MNMGMVDLFCPAGGCVGVRRDKSIRYSPAWMTVYPIQRPVLNTMARATDADPQRVLRRLTCAFNSSYRVEGICSQNMLCCRCWRLLIRISQLIIVIDGVCLALKVSFLQWYDKVHRQQVIDAACLTTCVCKVNGSISLIGIVAHIDDQFRLCTRYVHSMV